MFPLKLSATLYTTWKRCPAQARARLDGHYPPDTIDTFRGLLAHRIFARHLRDGPISPLEFSKVCRSEIGSSNLNYKVAELGLKPREVESVILVVGDLYRRFPRVARAQNVSNVEVQLDHELDTGILLTGRIDAISNGTAGPAVLIDWKTGELGDAADQLRFYAVLYTLARSTMPLEVRAISIQTGEMLSEWVDHKTIIDTELELIDCIADLRSDVRLETPGPYCRWCPILEECTVGRRALDVLAYQSG